MRVTWYWKGSGVMYKESSPTGPGDTVTLDPSGSAWWYTDEAAACDLNFPAGTWVATYWVKAMSSEDNGRKVYTYLQVFDSGGDRIFSRYRTEEIMDASNIEKIEEKDLSFGSVYVPEGGKIAVKVCWVSTAKGSLEIHYNSISNPSCFTSPPDSPSCPVPELSTFDPLFDWLARACGIRWA